MEPTEEHADVLVECVAHDDVSMTLRTRAPVCGARTTVVHRLGRLRAAGAIAGFEVLTWPDEVVLSDSTAAGDAVRTFERFERWADAHEVSIGPAFDVQRRGSLVGPRREVLTLPMMSLELTSGDELLGVFPYQDDERTVTIGDCLDAYERRLDDESDVTDDAALDSSRSETRLESGAGSAGS